MKTVQQSHPKLAKALGISELYLKREDLHPYGSHKGRAIPMMMKEYRKREGIVDFVISSSGNAALAAAMAAKKMNQNNPNEQVRLTIFIGKNIPEQKKAKLEALTDTHITLQQVERPKQQAFQMNKAGEAKNLRQSTDDLALRGYLTLADELVKIPALSAVFVPTSSGTTAQGIAEGFAAHETNAQVHIVQTTSCHPMTKDLDPPEEETASLATCVADRVAHRKSAVRAHVSNGWTVSNRDITEAQELLSHHLGLSVTANGALGLAGLMKAKRTGWKPSGAIVCLITGA